MAITSLKESLKNVLSDINEDEIQLTKEIRDDVKSSNELLYQFRGHIQNEIEKKTLIDEEIRDTLLNTLTAFDIFSDNTNVRLDGILSSLNENNESLIDKIGDLNQKDENYLKEQNEQFKMYQMEMTNGLLKDLLKENRKTNKEIKELELDEGGGLFSTILSGIGLLLGGKLLGGIGSTVGTGAKGALALGASVLGRKVLGKKSPKVTPDIRTTGYGDLDVKDARRVGKGVDTIGDLKNAKKISRIAKVGKYGLKLAKIGTAMTGIGLLFNVADMAFGITDKAVDALVTGGLGLTNKINESAKGKKLNLEQSQLGNVGMGVAGLTDTMVDGFDVPIMDTIRGMFSGDMEDGVATLKKMMEDKDFAAAKMKEWNAQLGNELLEVTKGSRKQSPKEDTDAPKLPTFRPTETQLKQASQEVKLSEADTAEFDPNVLKNIYDTLPPEQKTHENLLMISKGLQETKRDLNSQVKTGFGTVNMSSEDIASEYLKRNTGQSYDEYMDTQKRQNKNYTITKADYKLASEKSRMPEETIRKVFNSLPKEERTYEGLMDTSQGLAQTRTRLNVENDSLFATGNEDVATEYLKTKQESLGTKQEPIRTSQLKTTTQEPKQETETPVQQIYNMVNIDGSTQSNDHLRRLGTDSPFDNRYMRMFMDPSYHRF